MKNTFIGRFLYKDYPGLSLRIPIHLNIYTTLQTLFYHFQKQFPPQTKAGNIRIQYQGRQLILDLPWAIQFPIKLINAPINLVIKIVQQHVNGYNIFVHGLKQSLLIINPKRGISSMQMGFTKQDQLNLYKNYCQGFQTNIFTQIVQQNFGQIYLKIVIQNQQGYITKIFSMVDNKSPKGRYMLCQNLTVKDLLNSLTSKKIKAYCHGFQLQKQMNLHQFYKEYHSQDGYWHLRIQMQQESQLS